MTKIVLKDIVGGYNLQEINNNFNKLETALNEKVLYRTNPTGDSNVMNQTLDMNGYSIINVGTIDSGGVPVPAPVLAEDVVFNPIGSISATNVQDAIEELMNEGTGGGGGGSGVSSFNTRTGAVTLQGSDIIAAQGFASAPTVSPAFTGTVTVPTATLGDNSTKAASTAFVTAAVASVASGSTYISLAAFGGVGDGVTNNDAAFTNAIIAAKASEGLSLYIPPGKYIKTIEHDVTELTVWSDPLPFGQDGGAQILQSTNAPVFSINNSHGFCMQNISITGANNPAFTNNIGFKATFSSNIRVINCDFYYLYDSIQQLGECFYTQYESVRGYNHHNCFFNGIGNTAPGFDTHFSDVIITSITGVYGWKFTQAGSVSLDTCIVTPNGMSGASCFFDSDASLSGIHQITNSVFESGANGLYLKGTPSQKIKYVHISNTYIASPSSVAMRVDYGHTVVGSTYFTSNAHAVKIYNDGDVSMSNCEYQVLDVVLTADPGATNVRYSSAMGTYNGGFAFVYLPFLDNVKVDRVDIIGGSVGSNPTPADLPANTAGVRWAKGIGLSSTAGVSAFNTRTGSVTLTSADVGSAISSASTFLTTPTMVRSTGVHYPVSGAGLELQYDAGTSTGYLVSYNRGTSTYQNMNIDANSIGFKSGAAQVHSSGNFLIGYGTNQGAYKLQVNGDQLNSGAIFCSTPATATTGNRVATCDYVIAKLAAGGVTSFNTRTGAVTLNSTDVSSALGYTAAPTASPNHTGLVSSTGGYRATGTVTPGSGASLELNFDTGSNSGYVVSYNRSSSTYLALNLDGSSVNLKSGAVIADAGGNLLVGYGSSQGAYKLQVNSQIYATSATIATSDKRVKEDVKPLSYGLDTVMSLKPVTYRFIKHEVHNFPEGTQVGFLAQDVEEVVGDVGIVTENGDGLKGLAEAKLIPILVKAIQELKQEIEELKARK